MNPLHAFGNGEKSSFLGGLKGALNCRGSSSLELSFSWDLRPSPEGLGFSKLSLGSRKDDLWMDTCFEAFLLPSSGTGYFEINLSPMGDWNVYQFQDYRNPAPPVPAKGWILESFRLEPHQVSGQFSTPLDAGLKFRFGLSAVLVSPSSKAREYFSLTHPGGKPDFHDPKSFILSGVTQ